MKKFILNSVYFLLILSLVAHIRPLYRLYNDRYKEVVLGNEIYYSIFKSKQKKKSKKVLIGDSVGNQLFNNKKNNDTINSLACNQSIGLVGHFILLNNYLNAGNEVDTVYMLFSPFSFRNNLNQVFTYHYFLKPFYNKENKPYFTETVAKQIDKIPYHNLCQYPIILTSDWAPDFTSEDSVDYTVFSPISVEYLQKIKELSISHHFKLILVPPPASFTNKPLIEKMNKEEAVKTGLKEEFDTYFNDFFYLPDNKFTDGTHLIKPEVEKYTRYYRTRFIK